MKLLLFLFSACAAVTTVVFAMPSDAGLVARHREVAVRRSPRRGGQTTPTDPVQPPCDAPPCDAPPPTTSTSLPSNPTDTPSSTDDNAPSSYQPSSTITGSPPLDTGTHTGEGTFFNVGEGACGGLPSNNDQTVVAIAHDFFDIYTPGANPNFNTLCGRQIEATYNEKKVTVTVVDRCGGCGGEFDLDFSPAAFDQLADEGKGRLTGVTWQFA